MKNVRLNHNSRNAIFSGIIKHRFDGDLKMLTDRYVRLASAVYQRTFTSEQVQLIDSLPEGWLEQQNGINFTVGGHRHWLRFDGHVYWDRYTRIREWDHGGYAQGTTTRAMPHAYKAVSVGASDLMAKELAQLEQLKTKLQEEFGKVSKQVDTMLKSYATTKTLLEAWPEVEPFLPAQAEVATPSVPAVSIPSLNAMLRLPASDEVAGGNVVRLVS